MPLGTRDVLLILRAKDQASRIIADVGRQFGDVGTQAQAAGLQTLRAGTALTGLGVGIAATGAAGLAVVKQFADAANEYTQQAALTLTQVDQVGVSLDTIKDIGREVAAEIPAPFEQMQKTLYDIFSSMDVNVNESKKLLTEFARAGVAGQVDMQVAGRATIAIMNAWGLPASDVNKVLDLQFQLVRKGVGTYEEFASSIGMAIPSARRAGQSVEELGGMLAFLTRNGLSADTAATSAARAFEVMTRGKTIDNMKDFGVSVLDANGNIRDMSSIATELGKKMENLTDAQKIEAIDKIFKGSGNNIQARRFWDMAIRNYDELNQRVGEMKDSAGALDSAYDLMFKQPQTQMQLFRNNLEILKTEFGDAFIPAVSKAVEWGVKLMKWFQNMDPHTKKMAIRIFAIASAFLLISGVIVSAVGAFMVLQGTLAMLGTSLGAIIGVSGLVLLAIVAIAAAAYLIYKNWDKIRAWWDKMWPGIHKTVNDTWQKMQEIWDTVTEHAVQLWHRMQEVWDTLTAFFVDMWQNRIQPTWDAITQFAVQMWHTIQEVWDTAIEAIKTAAAWFWDFFGPGIMEVWNALLENIPPIIQAIYKVIEAFVRDVIIVMQKIVDFIQWAWPSIWDWTKGTWDLIVSVLRIAWEVIQAVVEFGIRFIIDLWHAFGDDILPFIQMIWDLITGVISSAMDIIRGIIQFISGLIRGDWHDVWEGMLSFLEGILGLIRQVIDTAWQGIQLAFDLGISLIRLAWDTFWNALHTIVDHAKDLVIDSIKALLHFIDQAMGPLDEMLGKLGDVAGKIGGIVGKGISGIGGLFKAQGGAVLRNAAYIVGEHGPEVFVPSENGLIMNNSQLTGASPVGSSGVMGGGVIIQAGAIQVTVGNNVDRQMVQQVMDDSIEQLVNIFTQSKGAR